MDEITPDQELDLRGEVCPYTFVKTKLALEMMHPGEVLKVAVDQRFGQSGGASDLLIEYGLTATHIIDSAKMLL